MASTTKQTWLVTGCSSGLGLNISLSALRAGHTVIATARNVSKAAREHPSVEDLGGKWLELDVRSEDTEEIVRKAVQELAGGRIDVVVNNAGYTVISSLEDARSVNFCVDFLLCTNTKHPWPRSSSNPNTITVYPP